MSLLVDHVHQGLRDPLQKIFDILNFKSQFKVDAIGPETDFTIEKDWKSGHNVDTKWLLKHSNKKMIFKKGFGLLNLRSPPPTH